MTELDDVPTWRRRVITCSTCGVIGHRRDRCPSAPAPVPDRIEEIAELREAADALAADIVAHEKVRATVEERLAEAYERRAQIEVEIRRLRSQP